MKKCPNCEGNRIRHIHNMRTHKIVYKCNDCGYATSNMDEIDEYSKVDIDDDKKLLINLYRARNNKLK